MKVLYIVSSFPRNKKDTYVRWLLEMAERLSRRGVEITVLAPSYKGLKSHSFGKVKVERFRYFLRRFEDLTHEEGLPSKIKSHLYKFIFLFYLIAGFFNTLKICRREKFDIIHVHWPFPHALWAYAGAGINNSKIMLTFYAVELLMIKRKFRFLRPLLKRIIDGADKVTTFSDYIKDLIKENSKKEVEVIPYGTTIQERKVRPVKNKKKRILFVGRIIERKGLNYLIRAMPKILKQLDAKLILVGDGDELNRLKEISRNEKVESSIEFLGKVSNRRLAEEYRKCDVFVLPAIVDSKGDTEGLGVVLIEALLYKKPVIASAVGGISDVVINGKTGLLIPEKNPEELAKSITKVIKNKGLSKRLGEGGYKYVREKFDWDNIVENVISTYKELIN